MLILDASGNGIGGEDVEPVLSLYRLEVLNFADNAVEDMAQVLALEQVTGAVERQPQIYRYGRVSRPPDSCPISNMCYVSVRNENHRVGERK